MTQKNSDWIKTPSSNLILIYYQTYNPGASGYIGWKENIVTKTHNGQYYFKADMIIMGGSFISRFNKTIIENLLQRSIQSIKATSSFEWIGKNESYIG